jgi:hypothetical protein
MEGDLANALLRKGVGELTAHRASCAACHRSPLPGEQVHEMESGRSLCSLCLGGRTPVSSCMVHAAEKRLVVVPMARAA